MRCSFTVSLAPLSLLPRSNSLGTGIFGKTRCPAYLSLPQSLPWVLTWKKYSYLCYWKDLQILTSPLHALKCPPFPSRDIWLDFVKEYNPFQNVKATGFQQLLLPVLPQTSLSWISAGHGRKRKDKNTIHVSISMTDNSVFSS